MKTPIKPHTPSLSEYLPKHWLKAPTTQEEVLNLPVIEKIKEKIVSYEKEYDVHREDELPAFLRQLQGTEFKHDDPNVFIVTKTMRGTSLKPNITQKHFLYRGQSEDFPTCKPTIYRDKTPNYLVENIKRNAFEVLLESHPLYRLLQKGIQLSNNVDVKIENPFGLAQHYGFKTPLIDLTSDLDIASFFATTKYDADFDTYSPYSGKSQYGVIYAYQMTEPFSILTYTDGLSVIGLQPFYRPGAQKGFLWMPRQENKTKDLNDNPHVKKIFFKHDIGTTNSIFDKMKKGKILLKDEIVVEKSRLILSLKCFSEEVFNRNLYQNRGSNPILVKEDLKKSGFSIDSCSSSIVFTKEELSTHYEWIKAGGWEEFCCQIVFPNDPKGKLKIELLAIAHRSEYRDYFYR